MRFCKIAYVYASGLVECITYPTNASVGVAELHRLIKSSGKRLVDAYEYPPMTREVIQVSEADYIFYETEPPHPVMKHPISVKHLYNADFVAFVME